MLCVAGFVIIYNVHILEHSFFSFRNITLLSTVNFTYNEQVYNKILLVTKSIESPSGGPITGLPSIEFCTFVTNFI